MSGSGPGMRGRPVLAASAGGLVVAAGLTLLATMALHVPWLLAWVVVLSMVTFLYYRIDKIQSENDGFRIPELTLLTLGLLGGTPGGFAGQRVGPRHKTAKTPFQVKFWLTVAAQVAVAGFVLVR